MTNEQAKQLQRIREQYSTAQKIISQRGFAREAPEWSMIGFLLDLIPTTAVTVGWCEQCMAVVTIDAGPDGHIRPEHNSGCGGNCVSCPVPVLCGPVRVMQHKEQKLKEIRERRCAISPAPWMHVGPTVSEVQRGEMRQYVTRTVGCGDVPPEKFVITILNCGDVRRDIADAEFIAHAPDDIDFLLSLVDSQVAGSYKDDDALARFVLRCIRGCATDDQYIETLERVKTAFVSVREDTSTLMRSACIEKVKAMRRSVAGVSDPATREAIIKRNVLLSEVVVELESVTIQEQKS